MGLVSKKDKMPFKMFLGVKKFRDGRARRSRDRLREQGMLEGYSEKKAKHGQREYQRGMGMGTGTYKNGVLRISKREIRSINKGGRKIRGLDRIGK